MNDAERINLVVTIDKFISDIIKIGKNEKSAIHIQNGKHGIDVVIVGLDDMYSRDTYTIESVSLSGYSKGILSIKREENKIVCQLEFVPDEFFEGKLKN